eukprot:777028-Prorocentrum_minimum.AAC.2
MAVNTTGTSMDNVCVQRRDSRWVRIEGLLQIVRLGRSESPGIGRNPRLRPCPWSPTCSMHSRVCGNS